ncbi:MAG: hypothetical protein C5B50_21890 [Verrucomicrobia bacterium]|nr:MAG: hypothetical protein C5B50_21890 [Verrucomicrobiota bacterium]
MKHRIRCILLFVALPTFGYAPQRSGLASLELAQTAFPFSFAAPTHATTGQDELLSLADGGARLLRSGGVQILADQTVSFAYGARRGLTNRTDQVGSTTYHPDGNGNITNIVENTKTNAWTFDAYDRAISYQDADGNVIGYKNDGNGNVTNIIYPGNRNVYYLRDSLGQITTVTDWLGGQTFIGYNLNCQHTSITRPNGTVRLIGYNDAGETTNIVEKTTSGFPIAFFMLGWTNSARIAWEFAAPLPPNTNPPGRLLEFDADNRLIYCNKIAVLSDLNGNMTYGPLIGPSGFVSYDYNARNQLTSAGGLTYGYDPAGFRTSITNGTNVARFVINPNANLPKVLMRTRPGITNYYIWGLGLLYEIVETATNTSTLTYHFDLRGSTIAITDGNANIKERFEYSSYGMLLYRSDSTDTPFLYNGRYGVMTDANGLLYMQARYYNPYICRFVNPDPAGFAGGLNWYAYGDGNPVSNLDPFGLGAMGETGRSSWLNWQADALGFGKGFAQADSAASMALLQRLATPGPVQLYDDATAMLSTAASFADDPSGFISSRVNTFVDSLKTPEGVGGLAHSLLLQWALGSVMGGGGAAAKDAEDGIIYLRTSSKGGEYVGQVGNAARYAQRQLEHAALNPTESFVFQELERVAAGSGRSLDVAEEDWIRAGGGPQSTGGRLENDRHQMNDEAYRRAGGTINYP